MSTPAHLLLGSRQHGVRLAAAQLAAAMGADRPASWLRAADHERVHLHLNGSLLAGVGPGPTTALSWLAGRSRLTVTLHDLPQPSDGAAFGERRDLYRRLLRTVHGWAVCSDHERRLAHEYLDPPTKGLVVPLPVVPWDPDVHRDRTGLGATSSTVAVFGWVYPGKGHREVITAAAALRSVHELEVLALGEVAPGHARLVEELTDQARAAGVAFRVTGHVPDQALRGWLETVDVAVCGHRNVSASASVNAWIAAGRRPLVRDGRYAREMAALRPGCLGLYADEELPSALLHALRSPGSTRLPPGSDTRPHLDDAVRAYREWWATT